ncbi:MAG: hypothetical protein HFI86_06605 [Bacilli bacterium]|nr:hypothetical protein [Bacilli bacterium]
MKKVIGMTFLLVVGVFFLKNTNVSARDCEVGLQAPNIPQAYDYKNGNLVSLKTSADSCYGSNTAVYFHNFGSLPASYADKIGTVLYGDLMEEDPGDNPDEKVKEYRGYFNGRVLTDINLSRTVTPGIIDSQGDQTCELYMRFSISGVPGGPAIPAGLFYYNICMD